MLREAILQLQVERASNKKTCHITYQSFETSNYLLELPPDLERLVSKAKTRMLELKVNYKHKYSNNVTCPFCCEYHETFDHIFNCGSGVRVP